MKKHIHILLAVVLMISGCALLPQPDKFLLDKSSSAPIEGLILSDYDLVDVPFDNEIVLLDGGRVSIKRPNITLSQIDMLVNISEGDGVRFMTRTDTRKYKDHPGIVFDWTKNGSYITENGKKIAFVDSIKASYNSNAKIVFHQDGDFYSIAVNCDTVIKARTNLPGSEFMIIETLKSKAVFSALNMDNIFGFDRETILGLEEDNVRTQEEKVIFNGNNPK
jgi:hypothetical protein